MLPGFVRNESLRKIVPRAAFPLIKRGIELFQTINIDNVCADVMIPVQHAKQFFKFYCARINVFPLYLCPTRSPDSRATFWTGDRLIDFGVGYGVFDPDERTQARHRHLIEREMLRLGGRKLPYSKHTLSEDEFWATRGGASTKKLYETLRKKYHALNFPGVYQKLL